MSVEHKKSTGMGISIPQLRATVKGRVITPSDAGYDEARTVFYGGFDRRPALIVRVVDATDVSHVVSLARETGLELAVRSGGHSVAGHGVSDGGIVLDLADMRALDIDAQRRTAWAEAGLTAGDYTNAAGAYGLATGFGDTASVGIGGITLGGGVGYLVRKHGLTIDNLLAAEIVTADGQLLRVDAQTHPDLFWAIRGGGGNFGVATRFQFRLHEVGRIVGGMLLLPATPDVIASFIAEAEAAPEELSTIANVMPAPPMPFVPKEQHGRLVVMATMAYAGEIGPGERAIAPFRALATPIADMVRPMPYPEIYPPEDTSYHPTAVAHTMFVNAIDRRVAETIVDHLEASDASMRVAQLRVLGGAMARVPADATAFAHRGSRIMVNVAAFYEGSEDRAMREAWVSGFAAALRQDDAGAYVDFLGDEGEARVRAAYPASTWDRLRAIKGRYDPTNLFQLFLSHARRVQPAFDLASEHESAIRICMLTAGLPLAIELAASWLKGVHAAHVAQAMQRNLDVLSTTTRNIEPRHRSMRAVFDQSWALLSEDEHLIFARLSVFRGGFASDAAEQVAGASLANLATLVEKSLIHLESIDRFGMHELLHQYGIEKLEAIGETEATHARHSRYFAELMRRHEAALQQPQQLETMQAIERDFDNIRLAWEWSVEHRQAANLHLMLNSLYLFGFLGSRHVDTIMIFQQTLAQPIADRPLLGRLLARRWGSLHWWLQADSDYREALTSIEQALTIARAEKNDFEVAFCHLMVSYALMGMQRSAEAVPHLETSKALFESLGEPYYVCWTLSRMGYLYAALNNPDKEIEYSEQSLALARGMHNRFALFSCLYNLGSDYILNGDYITSNAYGAEALQYATETGQVCQISHGLSLLALRAFCEGDYSACQEYSDRSVRVIKDIILLVVQPYSLALLTLLACLHEEYTEAVRINEVSKHHSVNAMASQLDYWALAALACGLGHAADARTTIQNALQLTAPNIHAATTIWIVPCAAYTLAATDPAKAVELLAWVFTYPDTALNWARQWPLIDRLRTQLQAMMDRDEYHTHWEKGKARSIESITSYLHQEFCALADPGVDAAHHYLLTTREREILGLMATGMTNPQIAAKLVIGAGTVKTHTLNIYQKLEVANRTQAIGRAQELGLLPT